jgi:hypothetical protein
MALEVRPIMATQQALDPADRPVDVGLVGIVERCYRCGKARRSIAGILVERAATRAYLGLDDDLFLQFEEAAEVLREVLNPAWLHQQQIGPIKVRRSRQRPAGYLSNGCVWCDTIVGSFPLSEAVSGIGPERLPEHVFAHVLLPLADLRKAASAWLGQGGCGPDCDCGANGGGEGDPEDEPDLPW